MVKGLETYMLDSPNVQLFDFWSCINPIEFGAISI